MRTTRIEGVSRTDAGTGCIAHAALLGFDSSIMNHAGTAPVIYPYFFLNPEKVGMGGVAMWVLALLAAFVAGGFLFMIADRLLVRVFRTSRA